MIAASPDYFRVFEMHTLCLSPFSLVVVHIEPLAQVAFELTLPPSFVHSPSVSGATVLVLGGVDTGLFLTTANAGAAVRDEQAIAIAIAVKHPSKLFM